MKRLLSFATIILLSVLPDTSFSADSGKPSPNIVLIYADDMMTKLTQITGQVPESAQPRKSQKSKTK